MLYFAKNYIECDRTNCIKLLATFLILLFIGSCGLISPKQQKSLPSDQIIEKLTTSPYPADLDKTTISDLKGKYELTDEVNQGLNKQLGDQDNKPYKVTIENNITILESFLKNLRLKSLAKSPVFEKLNLSYLVQNPIYTTSDENIDAYLLISQNEDFRNYLIALLDNYITNNTATENSYALANLQYLKSDAFETIYDVKQIFSGAKVMREYPIKLSFKANLNGKILDIWVMIENLDEDNLYLNLEHAKAVVGSQSLAKRIDNHDYPQDLLLTPKSIQIYNYLFNIESNNDSKIIVSLKIDGKVYSLDYN